MPEVVKYGEIFETSCDQKNSSPISRGALAAKISKFVRPPWSQVRPEATVCLQEIVSQIPTLFAVLEGLVGADVLVPRILSLLFSFSQTAFKNG
jgi:hypothetical protein